MQSYSIVNKDSIIKKQALLLHVITLVYFETNIYNNIMSNDLVFSADHCTSQTHDILDQVEMLIFTAVQVAAGALTTKYIIYRNHNNLIEQSS